MMAMRGAFPSSPGRRVSPLANAQRHGHEVGSLKVLHADELPGDFGLYRVDAATGRLVGGEAPVARSRGPRRPR
jgi:hypothetical protein